MIISYDQEEAEKPIVHFVVFNAVQSKRHSYYNVNTENKGYKYTPYNTSSANINIFFRLSV